MLFTVLADAPDFRATFGLDDNAGCRSIRSRRFSARIAIAVFFAMRRSVLPTKDNVLPEKGNPAGLAIGNVLPEYIRMERSKSEAGEATPAACQRESMRDYVIRRAYELKQYQVHAANMKMSWHTLRRLAVGQLPNPNYNMIERCFNYYRSLETEG